MASSLRQLILELGPGSYWPLDDRAATFRDYKGGMTLTPNFISRVVPGKPLQRGDIGSTFFRNGLGLGLDGGDIYDFVGSSPFSFVAVLYKHGYNSGTGEVVVSKLLSATPSDGWALDITNISAGVAGLRARRITTPASGSPGTTLKNFSFNTNTTVPYTAEGGSWDAGNITNATISISTAEDSPNDTTAGNGVWSIATSGRNKAASAYIEWTGTYEQLGVPVGATITAINLSVDYRVSTYTTGNLTSTEVGPTTLLDSTGTTTRSTFNIGTAISGTSASYATLDGTQASGLSDASNTTIKLRVNTNTSTGGSNTAAVTVLLDWVQISVTYTVGGSTSTVTAQAAISPEGLHLAGMAYDGSTLGVWWDGIQLASALGSTSMGTTNTSTMRIGAYSFGGSGIEAEMSHATMFNRALLPVEWYQLWQEVRDNDASRMRSILMSPAVGIAYTESATISTKIAISSTEVAGYVESAAFNSTTSPSSSEVYTQGGTAYTESAIVATTTNVSTTEIHTISDTAAVSTITTLSPIDIALFIDSSTINSTTVLSSVEVSSFVDLATLSFISHISSTELSSFSDSIVVNAATSISVIDIVAFVDSLTIRPVLSVSSTELHEVSDFATVSTITTISANEIYAPGGTVYTESATANSTTVVNYIDIATYVDIAVLNSITTPSAIEARDRIDVATVSTITGILSLDAATYVDAFTIAAITTPASLDATNLVDSGVSSFISYVSSVELSGFIDSSIANNIVSVSSSDIATFVDSSNISNIYIVSTVETSDFVDVIQIQTSFVVTPIDTTDYVDIYQILLLTSVISTEAYLPAPQILVPISDVTVGGWQPSDGTSPLYSLIADVNQSTYIYATAV